MKKYKIRLERSGVDVDPQEINRINESIETFTEIRNQLIEDIPAEWKSEREKFEKINKATRSARQKYRRNSDSAYEPLLQLSSVLDQTPMLLEMENQLKSVKSIVDDNDPENAMKMIKEIEKSLGNFWGSSPNLNQKYPRSVGFKRGKNPKFRKSPAQGEQGMSVYYQEIEWRKRASRTGPTIGRLQIFLGIQKAETAEKTNKGKGPCSFACKSSHEDISLFFDFPCSGFFWIFHAREKPESLQKYHGRGEYILLHKRSRGCN
ncbi:MAG: hypothetical protein CM1200mP30_06160 [Pseudomonadota bacterium]|nr:MAG: hypothetical protein CM1200mP30_06160 [Pseudomonadota bacterium]